MKARIYLFSGLFAMGLTAGAATTTEAGTLKNQLSDAELNGSSLTVTGPIDASDFETLLGMTNLTSLDLSGATIVEYNGDKLLSGSVHSDANAIPNYAFIGSKITSVKLPSTLTAIGEGAFAGSKIQAIEFPASLKSIGNSAFNNCDNLKQVNVAAGIETGNYVFANCANLETASLNSIEVPVGAFRNCPKLETAYISQSVKSIGADAYAGCSKLTTISFWPTLETIGNSAFYGTGLEIADLSRCGNMTAIGDNVFADCLNLTTVYFPANITSLGSGLFFDNISLTDIKDFPTGLTEIPDHFMKGASNVNSLDMMNERIESIGHYAFHNLNGVERWKAPDSLRYIGDGAMEGWTSLEYIDASMVNLVPELGEDVWAGVENKDKIGLSVPDNLFEQFKATPQWQDFDLELSGVNTGIEDDFAGEASKISITLVGSELQVEAPSEIENVVVYNVAGRLLVAARGLDTTKTVIDMSNLTPEVIIVTVNTAAGTQKTVKFVFKG
ncbi:MAG: leucine-rich repeat domain-containing protein [Muribaculaceae bacterium]|nr:leucine-rich repeat domain-containing protein [Muribaculaceae bacterium]